MTNSKTKNPIGEIYSWELKGYSWGSFKNYYPCKCGLQGCIWLYDQDRPYNLSFHIGEDNRDKLVYVLEASRDMTDKELSNFFSNYPNEETDGIMYLNAYEHCKNHSMVEKTIKDKYSAARVIWEDFDIGRHYAKRRYLEEITLKEILSEN